MSTNFEAAVLESSSVPLIGDRPFIPDHKVYFADFSSKDIAHFVCGILNSRRVREYVESHTIQIQVSNIFKHLSIPQCDLNNPKHIQVIAFSKKAHSAPTSEKRAKYLAKIDATAEKIIN